MLHNYLVISVFPYFSDLNNFKKCDYLFLFSQMWNLIDTNQNVGLELIKSHINAKHLHIKQHKTIKQYKYDQISHKIAHTHIMCDI